jgi:hypothetical protein
LLSDIPYVHRQHKAYAIQKPLCYGMEEAGQSPFHTLPPECHQIHGYRTVAFIPVGLPVDLAPHIAALLLHQVPYSLGAVAQGLPTASNLGNSKASELKRRKYGASAF